MPGSIELRGMRVLVVGLARTGVATALFCAVKRELVWNWVGIRKGRFWNRI